MAQAWKKIFQVNGTKKPGVIYTVILIFDKINFKGKLVIINNKNHFILIKGLIYQMDIKILNIHVPTLLLLYRSYLYSG